MDSARRTRTETPRAKVVDFDEAMLDACPRELRAELIAEANLLAQALPEERRREELEAMARTLAKGGRDEGLVDRVRTRRLAAALRRAARAAP